MKINKIVHALCSAFFVFAAHQANAVDGTINVTGTVYESGCTVTASNVTVRVPTSFVADYAAAATSGPTSDASDGTVALTGCPAGMTVAFTIKGTPDTITPALFQVTPGTGQATGVGLQLKMDSETAAIAPAGTTGYYSTTDQGGATGFGVTKHFRVTPVSTMAAVTAGKLDTSLTFDLVYK